MPDEPEREPEALAIKLKYDTQTDKFELETNVKPQLVAGIISDFLRMQVGKGPDKREAKSGPFEITLKLFTEHDQFVCWNNCGNDGLRDGILLHALRSGFFEVADPTGFVVKPLGVE